MNKYQQIDIWWCAKCQTKWKCPSVPHTPECPKCGTRGWWQCFATPADLIRQLEIGLKDVHIPVTKPQL